MKNYTFLTYGLLSSNGDRKKPGRLSILVDLVEDKIYAVPCDIEHIDFAREILGFGPEENGKRYTKLIPSHIDCVKKDGLEIVAGVITGVSGIEIGYGVRHRKEDVSLANVKTLDFVAKGDVEISRDLENEVCMKYTY